MPSLSIYLSDDDTDWLAEHIGRGNVSPYVKTLIHNDKGRVIYEEDKRIFQGILEFALFFIGIAFILLVVGTNFFPGIGSFSYVIVLLTGGVLLTMSSVLNIFNRRKKHGTNSPVING